MGTVCLGLPVPKRVLLRSTPAWGATRKKVFANSGEGISIRASAWDAARWRPFWEAKKAFQSMYPRGLKWGVAGLIGGDRGPFLFPPGFACTDALPRARHRLREGRRVGRRHRVDCGCPACVRGTVRMGRRQFYRSSFSPVRPPGMRRPWQWRCRQSTAHVPAGGKKWTGRFFAPPVCAVTVFCRPAAAG